VKKFPLFPIKKVYGHDYQVARSVEKREEARERAALHTAGQLRAFGHAPLLPWAQTYSHLTGTGNTESFDPSASTQKTSRVDFIH